MQTSGMRSRIHALGKACKSRRGKPFPVLNRNPRRSLALSFQPVERETMVHCFLRVSQGLQTRVKKRKTKYTYRNPRLSSSTIPFCHVSGFEWCAKLDGAYQINEMRERRTKMLGLSGAPPTWLALSQKQNALFDFYFLSFRFLPLFSPSVATREALATRALTVKIFRNRLHVTTAICVMYATLDEESATDKFINITNNFIISRRKQNSHSHVLPCYVFTGVVRDTLDIASNLFV